MSSTQSSWQPLHSEAREKTKPWWRLVWCHERIHKQGQIEIDRRNGVEDAAAGVGAELLCLKKAKQFEHGSCRPGTMPYILLTDWREVKPCMEIMQGHKPQKRPVFIVVICEVNRQYARATRWVQNLSKDTTGPVYICQHMGSPHTLVDGILAQLNYLLKKDAMLTLLSLSVDRDAWPPLKACHISDQGEASSMQHDERSIEESFTWQSTASVPQEVDRVMSTILESCPSHIPVEQLLLDSMPETYDD